MYEMYKLHPLYYKFKEGDEVIIKKNLHKVNPDILDSDMNFFRSMAGKETLIIHKFNQCCMVLIDEGKYAWSYEWFELKENLPDDWFEI